MVLVQNVICPKFSPFFLSGLSKLHSSSPPHFHESKREAGSLKISPQAHFSNFPLSHSSKIPGLPITGLSPPCFGHTLFVVTLPLRGVLMLVPPSQAGLTTPTEASILDNTRRAAPQTPPALKCFHPGARNPSLPPITVLARQRAFWGSMSPMQWYKKFRENIESPEEVYNWWESWERNKLAKFKDAIAKLK